MTSQTRAIAAVAVRGGRMLQRMAGVGLVAGCLLALAPPPTEAAAFVGSYDFGGPVTDGDVFTFTFEGVISAVDNNLIEGVSFLSNFELGGMPLFDPADPGIFGGPLSVILAELSFDGTANSFTATNTDATDVIAFQTGFGAVLQSNAGFGPGGFSVSESFDPARWSVTVATAVAEPTPLTLLACGGLAWSTKRRSRAKRRLTVPRAA
ncbi:MAG: hypothetical protein AAGA68_07320 [Pseudomonadota bacterium]